MQSFAEYLIEKDDIRARSDKTGQAVDENVFVQVTNFASKIRAKNPNITREELLQKLAKEIGNAKSNNNHDLSYNNADESFFSGKTKKVSLGSRESWNNQLDIAVDSLGAVINHKDFTPIWKSRGGFRAFRVGNTQGQLARKWTARNLKGSTATPKTDIAFVTEDNGIFTASLKDETGGVLITSAAGETGAILESACDDLAPPNAKDIYKQINKIEMWMANDANSEKADKQFWKMVDSLNALGNTKPSEDMPDIPLGEAFLRLVYKEAATAEHKFEGDRKAIATHFLKLGKGDSAKFQNVEEYLKPFQPDADGFMFRFDRSSDDRYSTKYLRIGLGKHGLRGAQPAAFRVYPIKAKLQKEEWLSIQDEFVLKNDFESFRKEFGYKISREQATDFWNRRIRAVNLAKSAQDQKGYQDAIGYKVTKEIIKGRQNTETPKPKNPPQPTLDPTKPRPTADFAGGGFDQEWHGPHEVSARAVSTKRAKPGAAKPNGKSKGKIASKPMANRKSIAKPTASPHLAKPGLLNRIRGAFAGPQKDKREIDWKNIETDFKTGRDRVEDIGTKYKVDPSTIYKAARLKKWARSKHMETI